MNHHSTLHGQKNPISAVRRSPFSRTLVLLHHAQPRHTYVTSHRVRVAQPRHIRHIASDAGTPGGGSMRKWQNANLVPWPNLFWLVDPRDQARVGQLERLGYVRRYREQLLNDPSALATFSQQHRRYAARRWALLTPEDTEYARGAGFEHRLRDAGIGGVTYEAQVKCLHSREFVTGCGFLFVRACVRACVRVSHVLVKCISVNNFNSHICPISHRLLRRCSHAQDYAHWLATNGDNVVGGWVAQALADGAGEPHKSVEVQPPASMHAHAS